MLVLTKINRSAAGATQFRQCLAFHAVFTLLCPARGHPRRTYAAQSPKYNDSLARLAARIPKNTWDTHMHVVDPQTFPLDKAAQYTPPPHTLEQATSFLGQLGIQKMVIVQPSIYGNDNSCTLDGLRRLGPANGRAVIQFDPSATSHGQLSSWHELGVRGVRLNFKSLGVQPSRQTLAATMHAYADAVRSFGWVIELYIAIEDIDLLEPVVADLGGVKVCIDHVGHPSPAILRQAKTADDVPGVASMLRLLGQGDTWVKLSATYRLDRDPNHPIVESLCRTMLKARPDRCVFATDWPHTRYESLEVAGYIGKVLDWCEAEGVGLEQVLVTNAKDLFDAHG